MSDEMRKMVEESERQWFADLEELMRRERLKG